MDDQVLQLSGFNIEAKMFTSETTKEESKNIYAQILDESSNMKVIIIYSLLSF